VGLAARPICAPKRNPPETSRGGRQRGLSTINLRCWVLRSAAGPGLSGEGTALDRVSAGAKLAKLRHGYLSQSQTRG
jgi:hypothetical protein